MVTRTPPTGAIIAARITADDYQRLQRHLQKTGGRTLSSLVANIIHQYFAQQHPSHNTIVDLQQQLNTINKEIETSNDRWQVTRTERFKIADLEISIRRQEERIKNARAHLNKITPGQPNLYDKETEKNRIERAQEKINDLQERKHLLTTWREEQRTKELTDLQQRRDKIITQLKHKKNEAPHGTTPPDQRNLQHTLSHRKKNRTTRQKNNPTRNSVQQKKNVAGKRTRRTPRTTPTPTA